MGREGQANVPERDGQPEEREPLKGALNEQELAAMKAAAEEYRFVAEAKRAAYEAMKKAVEEQLAKMKKIANGPTRDERVRKMTLADEMKTFDQLNKALFHLALAAEDADHWAGEMEKGFTQAQDAANGIEPQVEQYPLADQEFPDMGDLQRDEERRRNGILSEHELEELQQSAEAQQEEANRLRDAIQAARQEADRLDARAHEIVEILGYYRDERARKLDLGDVNTALAQTEQRIQTLMQQAAEADRRAEELKRQYEESKKCAEQYDQLQDEGFPEEEVEPNEPNGQDELAKALAEKEAQATEVYEMARSQMIQIQTAIDLTNKKPPEQRAGDIPLDVLQDALNRWTRDLPGLRTAMEKAKEEARKHQLEVEREKAEKLARDKKDYIRSWMSDTVGEQLDKITELYCHQDDPDGPVPPPITGLSVHADKLRAGNADRHGSQEWNKMFEALSDLDLEDPLRDLRRAHADGELEYDGEQISDLRRRIDLAAEQTQRYVDYKSGTLLVKLGIGRGSEYLSEAQAALRYLRDIQACIQTMDKQYAEVAENAKAQFDPKPAAAPEEPKPQQTNTAPRTSLNRNVTNVRNKGNVGPHIP